jgi:hypothetical protein
MTTAPVPLADSGRSFTRLLTAAIVLLAALAVVLIVTVASAADGSGNSSGGGQGQGASDCRPTSVEHYC